MTTQSRLASRSAAWLLMALLGGAADAGPVTINVPIPGAAQVAAPPAPAAGLLQHEALVISVLAVLMVMSLILAMVALVAAVRTRRHPAPRPQERSEDCWREPGFD